MILSFVLTPGLLHANAVMGTINGIRGEHEAAERYLRRTVGLGKAHLQEIEVLGK